MLTEQRKITHNLQLNTANTSHNPEISEAISPESRHNITTIAELRSAYIARQRTARRRHNEQHRARIIARWQHARVIMDMLDRLAICFNTPNACTVQDIYALFESTGWKCPFTAQWHSENTPLNIHFLKSLDIQHGTISIDNMRPKYYPGLFAGEYHIQRRTVEFKPPVVMPVLAMGA